MSAENRDNFMSFFPTLMPNFLFLPNYSDKDFQLRVATLSWSDLEGKAFNLSPLSILALGLLCVAFIILRYVSFIPNL